MKKLIILGIFLLLAVGFIAGFGGFGAVVAQIGKYFIDDPDMPPIMAAGESFAKEDFLRLRAEGIALKRGIGPDTEFDPLARPQAIAQMEQQEEQITLMRKSRKRNSLLTAWTPLGPAPIPNGQTIGFSTPVSGRVISIAVHPTNPDIVYVGAAQGGLYRSTDGGTSWTPLMDNALSLAIGAIAIAPSQPDTIYVGTGEAGFCGDCFFGVGIYRIDNASVAPVITGPLNGVGPIDVFTGRSIGEIVVHPTNPAIIFVSSASGSGGIGGAPNNVLPARGLFRSTDATSADPTFTKMTITGPAAQDRAILDIVMDPGNPDLLLCTLVDTFALGEGGVYRSTDALGVAPTFTRTFAIAGTGSNASRTELALHRDTVTGVVTVYAASAVGTGSVQRSVDGGATWLQQIDNNFCNPQCFYDIAIDVDPTNVNNVYIGGSPNLAFGRSTNGGTTFTNNAATSQGLHVDSHAIAVAPSLPTTIYFGSDGGIYKSTNSGTNWTPLNNSQFSATQFMSLALHPTDRNFTIGGTQDNGTNFYKPDATWTRADFGDGGYAVIDQSALNTTNVNMYHTYFNGSTLQGYGFVSTAASATEGNWIFRGCNSTAGNGIPCGGAVLFYAPLEQGPGTPNATYFGANILYRSANTGLNHTAVSQNLTNPISAIGISPQDDNVRIVGTSTGGIFGTSTGANPLLDLDASAAVPNNFIARSVVDPNNATTAYVTLSAFNVNNVWKTTNLSAVNPTWTAANGGLPLVPVSAFVIDPQNPNILYAGTDIGVYQSLDGGTSWLPFGTGLPRVAVFDMEILNIHRILRIATHGRGLYEISIPGSLLAALRPAGDGTSGPGGASALVGESCGTPNGAIDPGETVTVSYSIQNLAGAPVPTTNLTATLQATGGVTSPSGPQNYGAIAVGTTATQNFTFTASGTCGATITLTFQLQDGATNYGNVTVTYTLGASVVSPSSFTQNFDGVSAPALPAGWTTAQVGSAPLWSTSTTAFDTTPNSAFGAGNTTPGDNSLTTPTTAIPAAPGTGIDPHVELNFRNSYNTESGFDGGVLEISINGGAFTDIVNAGGTFLAGGYNGAIGVTDSVLTGRAAWTGNSNGFITTTIRLPAASYGQNVQFRWRTAYDTGVNPAGGGLRVDTVSIYAITRLCCTPAAANVTVGGRVNAPDGRAVRNAVVSLRDTQTNLVRRVNTNSFGTFSFDNVPTGVTYMVSVNSKLFRFASQQVTPTDNISNLIFVGFE